MIGAAAQKGVTTVLMQGGLNSKLPLSYYTDLLRECRRRYPQVHPHFFSAPEVMKMSQVSGLSVRDVLAELKDAGLESIPGGGSEILSNTVKYKISRLFPKGTVDHWTQVHLEAHRLGLRTTATMMYGHLEKDEDIIEHLEHVRALQDETGGSPPSSPGASRRPTRPSTVGWAPRRVPTVIFELSPYPASIWTTFNTYRPPGSPKVRRRAR